MSQSGIGSSLESPTRNTAALCTKLSATTKRHVLSKMELFTVLVAKIYKYSSFDFTLFI